MFLRRCSDSCRTALITEFSFAICVIAHPKVSVRRNVMAIVTSRNQGWEEAGRTNFVAIISRARRGCRESGMTSQARKTREAIFTGASENFSVIRRSFAKRAVNCKMILATVFAFSLRNDNAFRKEVASAAIALWQILN